MYIFYKQFKQISLFSAINSELIAYSWASLLAYAAIPENLQISRIPLQSELIFFSPRELLVT